MQIGPYVPGRLINNITGRPIEKLYPQFAEALTATSLFGLMVRRRVE